MALVAVVATRYTFVICWIDSALERSPLNGGSAVCICVTIMTKMSASSIAFWNWSHKVRTVNLIANRFVHATSLLYNRLLFYRSASPPRRNAMLSAYSRTRAC